MRRLLFSLPILLVACGGGERSSDTAPASRAAAAPAAESWDPATITPQMLALGDSLFKGLIGGGSCQACHGADGKQGTVAPDLTDGKWLHSDGSWEGIHTTIKNGVMAPKEYSSMMMPFGGAPMTPAQSRAVAAYVYKLANP